MATLSDSVSIRVVMFQEAGKWVGQCLEYDIGAQADTIDDLTVRLQVVLKAELAESVERHGRPFAGIDRAPERYQLMWERRARSLEVSLAPWVAANRDMSLDYALV